MVRKKKFKFEPWMIILGVILVIILFNNTDLMSIGRGAIPVTKEECDVFDNTIWVDVSEIDDYYIDLGIRTEVDCKMYGGNCYVGGARPISMTQIGTCEKFGNLMVISDCLHPDFYEDTCLIPEAEIIPVPPCTSDEDCLEEEFGGSFNVPSCTVDFKCINSQCKRIYYSLPEPPECQEDEQPKFIGYPTCTYECEELVCCKLTTEINGASWEWINYVGESYCSGDVIDADPITYSIEVIDMSYCEELECSSDNNCDECYECLEGMCRLKEGCEESECINDDDCPICHKCYGGKCEELDGCGTDERGCRIPIGEFWCESRGECSMWDDCPECVNNNDCYDKYESCYYICSEGGCNQIKTFVPVEYPDCKQPEVKDYFDEYKWYFLGVVALIILLVMISRSGKKR